MSADRCPYCASTYPDHVAAVRNAGWCGNAAVRGLYCGPPEPRERPALRLVHDPDTDGCRGCTFNHGVSSVYCVDIARWLEDL